MPNDTPLPPELTEHFLSLLTENFRISSKLLSDEEINDKEGARILSEEYRQSLVDEKVDSTLQRMNQQDEEGRSLPEELTVDDVGRTVLRRAQSDDARWIAKLLALTEDQAKSNGPQAIAGSQSLLPAEDDEVQETAQNVLQSWSKAKITLLLCRAIAPFEDPPLGCAVLRLGFSIEDGIVLRISQIGSEPHLPKERFVECLQSFASQMGYRLTEWPSSRAGETSIALSWLREEDQLAKIDSLLAKSKAGSDSKPNAVEGTHAPSSDEGEDGKFASGLVERMGQKLQSVREESEDAEESDVQQDVEKRNAKLQAKPSKRSRVH